MRQLQLALSRYQRMNQLSLNLVSDDPPDYVIDDPVEKLEMYHPRETLLWLLEQQYGPQVKLERTKDNRANGVLYKCPCPVHHNDGETRGLVYLDQRLRIYCQSCKATRILPQLLENCEINPAEILQHILENLDRLQQHFELLDPDIEEEVASKLAKRYSIDSNQTSKRRANRTHQS